VESAGLREDKAAGVSDLAIWANGVKGDSMELTELGTGDVAELVQGLNFAEKVERSTALIEQAYSQYGDGLVVANSLGKDSVAVWHLAKRVSPKIRGFVVTTRYKPAETVQFMNEQVAQYPELEVFRNDAEIPQDLYVTDPDRCCEILKVEPTRRAIEAMGVSCWVTGLRCTEGRTRTDFKEIEQRDPGLIKLNPILIWYEREVWQYLALNKVSVNPLYAEGYRSLGCAPCTKIAAGADERAGRWIGTSKCGGECGIHTRPLKAALEAEGGR
jgi:phosphoadenosine phosphosulfate reductase